MSSTNASISEEHGLQALPMDALNIYSVGISTAGAAEIRMAQANPRRHIVATTIDEKGAVASRKLVQEQGFGPQIEVTVEDVAKQLPHSDDTFDYVYARLVLHYLTKQQLQRALAELHRILKPGGKLFVVVRTSDNLDATTNATGYDEITGMTTFTAHPNKDTSEVRRRYFHTKASISQFVTAAGFTVERCIVYDETLFHDYARTVPVDYADNLVELLAVK